MQTEPVVAARLTSKRSGHFQNPLIRQECIHNSVTVGIF